MVMAKNQLLSDLVGVVRRPSPALQLVTTYWDQAIAPLKKERQILWSRIGPDDPIKQSCDLLSPLRSAGDEVLHTLALAYLIDPEKPHGLKRTPLRQLLLALKVFSKNHRPIITSVLSLITHHTCQVLVIPERRHLLAQSHPARIPRTDIWIEITYGTKRQLMIIENKVGARESDRQLLRYERLAKHWCKTHTAGFSPLLVFLTPQGRSPASSTSGAWLCLSYATLANALRKVLRSRVQSSGSVWLRLYISTLLRHVLGMRVDQQRSSELSVLRTYLAGTR